MQKHGSLQANKDISSDDPHYFKLKKMPEIKLKNSIPKNTMINFTPSLTNPHELNPKKKKYLQTLPKYNKDGHFFTPAFLIPYFDNFTTVKKRKAYQKFKYEGFQAHLQNMQDLANSKLSKRNNKKSNKENQKVNSVIGPISSQKIKFDPGKQNYCIICSIDFDDYWFHINEEVHMRAIIRNQANGYINELCQKYKKVRRLYNQTDELKADMKTASQLSEGSQKKEAQTYFSLFQIPKMTTCSENKKASPQTIIPQRNIFSTDLGSEFNNYRLEFQEESQNSENFDIIFSLKNKMFADNYELDVERNGVWDIFMSSNDQKQELSWQKRELLEF